MGSFDFSRHNIHNKQPVVAQLGKKEVKNREDQRNEASYRA